LKIVLGTANFSSIYGINHKKVKEKELHKIISYCKRNKIHYLDTATVYKNYNLLSKLNISKFKIITKLKDFSEIKKNNIEEEIINYIENLLKSLKIKQIYGLLLHDIKPMYSKNADTIIRSLELLKKKKLVKKIGISCYKLKDINLIKKYKFEIVQFPLNIFDQRLLNKKTFSLLNKKKIEVHARSIFLQGLLLQDFKKLPNYFNKWKNEILKYENFSKKSQKSKFELCVNFIKQQKLIDMMIVGVENKNQIDQIRKQLNKKNFSFNYNFFSQLDDKLILPYLWKINQKTNKNN
jgi:aryl-alcohol dehydrogenase-like predicted oxidoreductase